MARIWHSEDICCSGGLGRLCIVVPCVYGRRRFCTVIATNHEAHSLRDGVFVVGGVQMMGMRFCRSMTIWYW